MSYDIDYQDIYSKIYVWKKDNMYLMNCAKIF